MIPAWPVLHILNFGGHRNVVKFKLGTYHICLPMSQAEIQNLVHQIKQDEEELKLPRFTNQDAFLIGNAIKQRFEEISNQEHTRQSEAYKGVSKANGIVICIETFTGMRLYSAVAGHDAVTKPDNWRWVEGKKNIVKGFIEAAMESEENVL